MAVYDTKQFSVDSHGAYLTRLVDEMERPILFEQTLIDGKRRGGSHVCLPYFGADAAGVLPQHGWGRDEEWTVERVSDREIRCRYEDGQTKLRSMIIYTLNEAGNSLTTELRVENGGSEPVVMTPGFHPYFAVDPSDVRLNGERINLADFEPYQSFPDRPYMTIESGGRTVDVSSDNLHHMVVWSNQRGNYLCVEPTHSGHSFDSRRLGADLLRAGENTLYSHKISWS